MRGFTPPTSTRGSPSSRPPAEASAYFFCLEDRAVLCGQCDVSVHTTNSYVSAHQRFLLTGLRVGLEPFKPVSSLDKEQSESKQKSVETPMYPLPCPNPPLSLCIYTSENISDQVGNGGLAGNELSFSGATMSGTSSGWPSDELFGFTDFNQTYQFTEHALSKEASAFFCCLEDCAFLCGQCVVSVHTTNSYISAHQRFLLTGVRVGLEPSKPGASLDMETPIEPLPCQSPPLLLSIYPSENIFDRVANGDLPRMLSLAPPSLEPHLVHVWMTSSVHQVCFPKG